LRNSGGFREEIVAVLFIWLAGAGVAAAILSGWGTWKAYRAGAVFTAARQHASWQQRSKLSWLSLGVLVLAFFGSVAIVSWSVLRLLEPRHYENTGTMWLPLARVVVTASGQDVDVLLRELSKFADDKNADTKTFPKSGRSNIDIHIALGPETYFVVHNRNSPKRFDILAYSHDEPSAWTADWQLLIDRLTARLGKERVAVRMVPPN
jgi:hypothetical protein